MITNRERKDLAVLGGRVAEAECGNAAVHVEALQRLAHDLDHLLVRILDALGEVVAVQRLAVERATARLQVADGEIDAYFGHIPMIAFCICNVMSSQHVVLLLYRK